MSQNKIKMLNKYSQTRITKIKFKNQKILTISLPMGLLKWLKICK
jgi:hypothetical protein